MAQPVSPGFLAAWRGTGQRVRQVLLDGAVVPYSSYRVDAARGENVVARYAGTVVLAPGAPAVHPYGARVVIRSGFRVGGADELVTLCTLVVESVESAVDGSQTLTGYSIERYVEVAGFEGPTLVDAATAVQAIQQLVSVVPAPVSVRVPTDRLVPPATFDQSQTPWQAVRSFADALAADVFADPFGGFVVAPAPTLADAPAVTLDPAGVLIEARRKRSRTGVPSVVVVEGNRTGTGGTAPRGVARDDNPYSPTYYLGVYGRQQRTVNSPIMLTDDQCSRAAQTILAQSQGLARSLTMTAAPADFLLPGDVALVPFADGPELHIIDSLTHSSDDAPQSYTTRSTRGS